VALASMFPQARSVGLWVTKGWYVSLAYVIGFAAMVFTIGFHPGSTPRGQSSGASTALSAPAAAASSSN
jgi:hypothetical protein